MIVTEKGIVTENKESDSKKVVTSGSISKRGGIWVAFEKKIIAPRKL